MSRICPQTGEKVIYLTCQDCDDRIRCQSGDIGKHTETTRETGDKNGSKNTGDTR